MYYRIVKGINARRQGMYSEGQLNPQDRPEKAFDSGYWVLPEAGYGAWFSSRRAASAWAKGRGWRIAKGYRA